METTRDMVEFIGGAHFIWATSYWLGRIKPWTYYQETTSYWLGLSIKPWTYYQEIRVRVHFVSYFFLVLFKHFMFWFFLLEFGDINLGEIIHCCCVNCIFERINGFNALKNF